MNSTIDPFDPMPLEARATLLAATERIAATGFASAGWWALGGNGNDLRLRLQEPAASASPALYAFTVDGALAYIGKTVHPLRQQLQNYQCPDPDAQSEAATQQEIYAHIVQALRRGRQVRIWAHIDGQSARQLVHGEDVGAKLEASLLDSLTPPWNRPRQASLAPLAPSAPLSPAVIHKPVPKRIPTSPLTPKASMTPTIENLLDFARSQRGNVLRTLRRNTPFRVEVIGNGFEFLPASGQARRERAANVSAVLKAFNAKGSWQMSDYQELSFNASYLLALLNGWQDSLQA